MADEIEIVEYDPAWPARFADEAARIATVLGEAAIAIEHVGSTAVPGLAAKPVIDIDVTLRSFADDRARAIEALEGLGYSYWAANPDPGHLFFVKGLPPAATRTHHVHVFARAEETARRRAFRDRLRADRAEAARYAALKRELASRHRSDRDAYTAAKAAYVAEVVARR